MCKVIEEMQTEIKVDAAKRMISDGILPLEKVAEYVDLPLNEIKSLQAEQSA